MNKHNPAWSFALPVLAWAFLALYGAGMTSTLVVVLVALGLVAAVVSAVHHAEVIAHRVGEPFGTLVLALSITTIEVALIVSMILSGGPDSMSLARDTLFAALMIILNAMVGICLLLGGRKHGVQLFNVEGMTDAVSTLAVISVLAFVMPNYLPGLPGPFFSPMELIFLATVTVVIFAGFTLFQTVLHRDYFLSVTGAEEHSTPPDNRTTFVSLALLLVSLVAVVLSAKAVSPTLEAILGRWGAPASTLGIAIAAIVLLPEFGASIRAARANRLQTSLNLAMGSAIASIGLTIPVVAALGVVFGWQLELGLDPTSIALLVLTLFVTALTLRTGKTTLLPGVLHLGLFAAFIFYSLTQ